MADQLPKSSSEKTPPTVAPKSTPANQSAAPSKSPSAASSARKPLPPQIKLSLLFLAGALILVIAIVAIKNNTLSPSQNKTTDKSTQLPLSTYQGTIALLTKDSIALRHDRLVKTIPLAQNVQVRKEGSAAATLADVKIGQLAIVLINTTNNLNKVHTIFIASVTPTPFQRIAHGTVSTVNGKSITLHIGSNAQTYTFVNNISIKDKSSIFAPEISPAARKPYSLADIKVGDAIGLSLDQNNHVTTIFK